MGVKRAAQIKLSCHVAKQKFFLELACGIERGCMWLSAFAD